MFSLQSATPHQWRQATPADFVFSQIGTSTGRASAKSANFGTSFGSVPLQNLPPAGSVALAGRRAGKSQLQSWLKALSEFGSVPDHGFVELDTLKSRKEAWICSRCGCRVRWDGRPPTRPDFPTDLVQAARSSFVKGIMNAALGRPEYDGHPIPDCDMTYVRYVMES